MPDAVALATAPPAALPVRRRPRLADLPAAPVLALLPLVPAYRPLVLRPAGEGRVMAEAGGGAIAGVVEVAGELVRELYLPRSGLQTLARRHPHAARLTVDGPDPDGAQLLLLRALDQSSSAAVAVAEAEPLGGSAADLLNAVPMLPAGDERLAMLDPRLLAQALDVMRRLDRRAPLDLGLPAHDTLGLLVKARPEPGGDLIAATVGIARMVASDG